MLNSILDILFPIRCLGRCERFDTWLCHECIRPGIKPGRRKDYIDSEIDLWYLAEYQTPLIQTAIHELKYNRMAGVASAIGTYMHQYLVEPYHIADQIDWVIPVPLHPKRFRERGFNQSALLADAMNAGPVVHAIERILYTPPQATLNRIQRLMNLESMFAVSPEYNAPEYDTIIKGKRCLLIDDVCTTGSTLRACAEQLKLAGASQVSALVVAID